MTLDSKEIEAFRARRREHYVKLIGSEAASIPPDDKDPMEVIILVFITVVLFAGMMAAAVGSLTATNA